MAKKNESNLWNFISKIDEDWHLTRIESNTFNGIPDVNCLVDRQEFWLELKSNDLKNCGLSKWQINWHCKRIKLGGFVFILNRPLASRAVKLLALNPVSRFPQLLREESFSSSGIRILLRHAAAVCRASRFPFPVTSSTKDCSIV